MLTRNPNYVLVFGPVFLTKNTILGLFLNTYTKLESTKFLFLYKRAIFNRGILPIIFFILTILKVCKENLPRLIKWNEDYHELITVEKPACPYIILEKLSADQKNSSTLSLIVPTDHEPIRLGRGHQCDLRISDISISRVHALLKYKDGKFLIFDNESKFGTLILLNRSYEIQNDKAAIQIGRTVFTFVLKYIKNTPQMILEPRTNG